MTCFPWEAFFVKQGGTAKIVGPCKITKFLWFCEGFLMEKQFNLRETYVMNRTSDGRVFVESIISNDASMDYTIRVNQSRKPTNQVLLQENVVTTIGPVMGSLGY